MVDAVPQPPEPAGDSPADGEPYQSLYRRYRPQRFEDVRGQQHVTRALLNAVRDDKVAHAYLFSGPRGTGKTSTARILAMALNCEHQVDGEPDGVCPSCVEIRQGSSLDVQELDAASNRKLDEMRDLLSRVALGISGRWKVYIVDEVHQLTSDAASALLKTLEEPPGHVVFVLATTDPQKVLPTIRSRTQHFEFRLLGADVLGGLLRDVNERAALGLAPEAIDLVVRRGHGSARDALSALDQVAAAGGVEDEAAVVSAIIDAVADRDPAGVLVGVAEATSTGRDPRRLATELLDHLRNGFLATQAPSLVLLAGDAVAEVEDQARRLGLASVVRALEVVGQAAVDMRESVDPRITLEVALVRLAAPAADTGADMLLTRIEHLERTVAQLGTPGPAPAAGAVLPAPAPRPGPEAPPAVRGDPPAKEVAAPGPPPRREPRPAVGSSARDLGTSPPALPGRRSGPDTEQLAGSRTALGAHRRARADGGTDPGSPGGMAAASPGASSAGVSPSSAGVSPGSAGVSPGSAGGLPAQAGVTPAVSPGPNRDELTKAWGDHVLPGLRPAVKVYLSSGRFVTGEAGTAVYAVPDPGLLSRAQPNKGEVEAALAAHFGRPVAVRFILDGDAAPVGSPPSDAPPRHDDEDPSAVDLDDLEDAGPGLVSPEQRLMEAFPGAEEVTP